MNFVNLGINCCYTSCSRPRGVGNIYELALIGRLGVPLDYISTEKMRRQKWCEHTDVAPQAQS